MAGTQGCLALAVLACAPGLTRAAGAQGSPTHSGEYRRHLAVTNEERHACIHDQ